MQSIVIDKEKITIDDLVAVSRGKVPVSVSPEGYERVEKATRLIAKWVGEERVIYGITTGFGAMCNVTISAADTCAMQKNGDQPVGKILFWYSRKSQEGKLENILEKYSSDVNLNF